MAKKLKFQFDALLVVALVFAVLVALGLVVLINDDQPGTVGNDLTGLNSREDTTNGLGDFGNEEDKPTKNNEETGPEVLQIEGDTGTEFIIAGHTVLIESVEYRDEAEAGMDGFGGLAGTGKLLWIAVRTTNNTGTEQNYSAEQYSMVSLGEVLEANMNNGGLVQQPFTLTDGGSKFYYLIFDNPQIDGQPIFRWSPPNTEDRMEVTLPEATEIPGYN